MRAPLSFQKKRVKLMTRERDKLLGAPRDGGASVRRTWPVPVAVIAVMLVIGLAFVVGRTTALQTEENRAEESPQEGSLGKTETGGVPTKSSAGHAQAMNTGIPAAPRAMNADFLITDRLLANSLTYDDFQGETVTTSVCLGDPLRIGNVSSQRVGLIDTPEASDASAQLGFVDPGAVFTIEPQEPGTFFISAAGIDGLLFRYSAERCHRGRSRPTR
jgi:hypothetical protein